jgi:hypothetical protein
MGFTFSGGAMALDGKEFSAKVPLDEYNRFKQNFDSYGAVNWFINTALKEFNDRVAANPTLKQLVNEAIDEMLVARRESRADV